ncbi:marvel domain-containing protein [Daldinia sp. FL1419]|nr:marvel domain-containing protein [Daldinia sp. FL1419]
MLKIAVLGVRGFLLLFGAVVLGLSVTLAKQQNQGSPPAETSFGSFCGAFGILVSLIGAAALFFDKIPSIVSLGADGLATALYLAGAISLTVALKSVTSCTSDDDFIKYERANNKLLDGGCPVDTDVFCRDMPKPDDLKGRCQRVQADYVFEYLAFVFGVAIIALTFFLNRGKGSRSAAYV